MDGVMAARAAGTRIAGEPGGWAVCWRPTPGARLRLFCVPHAGGGAITYRAWAHLLAPEIELIAVRLPGRESRFREPRFTRLPDLVPELIRGLEPWLDRPHAWFGHSLGALIAFEACRQLSGSGLRGPARLLVAGRPAPHLPVRMTLRHDAPFEELLAQLRALDGTPREVLDDPAALAFLLPSVRSDLAMVESYRCRPGPPLNCPISVFGGTDDPFASALELGAWRLHSTEECSVRMFPGRHFFLHRSQAQVLAAVTGDLSRHASRPQHRT